MKRLYWIKTARRNTLAARVEITGHNYDPVSGHIKSFATGISEGDMDPVQAWCEENNCGVRTSFDTFKFKNKKEMTMFLLRWA